jgi:hypothetical protein
MTATLATLNPAALVTLADCEQRIERGLKSFIDVGEALATIHNGHLYRRTHTTFEDYCRERWNLSRPRAYELMAAADVVSGMPDTEVQVSNARQANALAAVPEAERAEVWNAAVERTNGKPTAAAVREVHEERTRPTTPGPVDPTTSPADPGATSECVGVDMDCGRPLPCPDHPTLDLGAAPAPAPLSPSAPAREPDSTPGPAAAPSTAPAGPGSGEEAALREGSAASRPDQDEVDLQTWRLNFSKALTAAFRVPLFDPVHVAEKADAEHLDQLRRLRASIEDYANRVDAALAASMPDNVRQIRRTS